MNIQRQKLMVIRRFKELIDLIQELTVENGFKNIDSYQLTAQLLNTINSF